MSNIDKTLKERGARYGEFPEHAYVTQELKRTLHDNVNWGGLADDQKEALDMVMHKVGRIINGDPNYIDSWTDIIGYARLVEKRLIDEQTDPVKSVAEKIKETTKEVQSFSDLVRVLDKIHPKADAVKKAPADAVKKAPTDELEDQLTRKLREIFGPNVEVRRVD